MEVFSCMEFGKRFIKKKRKVRQEKIQNEEPKLL